ncbi:MAG: hypothetical protein IJ187_02385 [Neisseriaceae bacterium]|nr:hypothetical protein [Neisseriaceae bacterium]
MIENNKKQKKIIYFSTPAFGHINAEYPVVSKLIENGYSVDWYCSKKYKNFVEETGANYREYKIDFDKYNLSDITANFYNLFENLLALNRDAYLLYINEIQKERPDLILYDSMCSFAKNISKKLNIKSICLSGLMAYNLCTFIFSHMFISTIKLIFSNLHSIIKLYNEEKKFRISNGLGKFNLFDLFVNKGDLTLVFSPKEFQPFYRTFDKSFIFVGTTIKDRLKRSNKKYDKYDIYVSLGTIFTENSELLNNIINNELLKGKHTIISVGDLQMDNLPDIEFVKSTDQLALLSQLDLFINHGGLCSVYESIYFGVFQICIPQQEEHRLTAQMIKRRKIGMYVEDINKLNIKKLEKFRKRNIDKLEKYQTIIRSYDGSQLAFEKVEEILKNV